MLNGQFVTALELEGREDGAQVMAVLLESNIRLRLKSNELSILRSPGQEFANILTTRTSSTHSAGGAGGAPTAQQGDASRAGDRGMRLKGGGGTLNLRGGLECWNAEAYDFSSNPTDSELCMPSDVERRLEKLSKNVTRLEMTMTREMNRRCREARKGLKHPLERDPPEAYIQFVPHWEAHLIAAARRRVAAEQKQRQNRSKRLARKRRKLQTPVGVEGDGARGAAGGSASSVSGDGFWKRGVKVGEAEETLSTADKVARRMAARRATKAAAAKSLKVPPAALTA